jgi:hypothetical protein
MTRRPQFRLRSLFILTAIVAVGCLVGQWAANCHRERQAKLLKELMNNIKFDHGGITYNSDGTPFSYYDGRPIPPPFEYHPKRTLKKSAAPNRASPRNRPPTD